MTLQRRTPLRARKRAPMPPHVVLEVFARDLRKAGGCVPKYLGAPGPCRDKWGTETQPGDTDALTIGHVREHSGGKRRNEPDWLILACWGHGVQSWELSHVQELRDYLAAVAS